jgi:ADP-heptose:LPS heptosyltransferase
MHLAAAMHQPVLALFGPTDHERFGPYPIDNPRHTILRARGGKLDHLGVDEVFNAILNRIKT